LLYRRNFPPRNPGARRDAEAAVADPQREMFDHVEFFGIELVVDEVEREHFVLIAARPVADDGRRRT
jgi:hypothetical protein